MTFRKIAITIAIQFWAVFGLLLMFSTLAFGIYDSTEPGEALFQKIVRIKTKYKINRIEDILPLLDKELLKNHILIFSSGSLQEASYLNPRILLHSKNADFIMTFNGQSSQEGYHSLETLRFIHRENRFIFEEIVFEGDLQERIQFQKSKGEAHVTIEQIYARQGANPKTCLACHQQDPRPNWSSYPFWPGIYGQNDDQPLSRRVEVIKGTDLTIDNFRAAENLPLFLKTAKSNRRYKHLVDLENQLPPPEHNDEYGTPKRRPLARFTSLLSQHNFKRIIRILRSHPSVYRRAKWVPLAIGHCEMGDANDFKLKLIGFPIFAVDESALMLDIFSNMMGFESSFLSMSFIAGTSNSLQTPGKAIKEFLYWLSIQDPAIQKYVRLNPSSGIDLYYAPSVDLKKNSSLMDCDSLRDKIRNGSDD